MTPTAEEILKTSKDIIARENGFMDWEHLSSATMSLNQLFVFYDKAVKLSNETIASLSWEAGVAYEKADNECPIQNSCADYQTFMKKLF